ncbi:60S ribosomal export protein [Yarrowia sp. B02]|nr:60S ribosomal export protein [Yarrowia sp. B02]
MSVSAFKATVLCHNCGTPLDGTLTNGTPICNQCIEMTTDITKEIPRESSLTFCRNCDRWLQPPSSWTAAQPESRELLALCLKRLKGLSKVRLVDASFIWTEPHSRRIRIKVTVQGEAVGQTIIQQSFEVEYIVVATQCPDCAKSFTANTWRASVQIRQKVPHKKTFLYLEQLILRHNAHLDTISIQESRDGLDFFYSQRNHALKMLDFLASVTPCRHKRSEELISMDTHTAKKQYKFSYSVEIAPICRDDLVVLPASIAKHNANIAPLVLCTKVTNTLHFVDPNTLQTCEIPGSVYWRKQFPSLADASRLQEFVVLDIEPLGPVKGKFALADATVARVGDMGRNDTTYNIRTHLGGVLHPGDSAYGYFLATSNFNNAYWDELDKENLPDVILVKKHYPGRRKKRNRHWKLKRMALEHNLEDDPKVTKNDLDKAERDYEQFLQELEEDTELRGTVNLYKRTAPQMPALPKTGDEMDASDEEGEGVPEIGVDELLDDLEDMSLGQDE